MSLELSETANAILVLLKKRPLKTDVHGNFITLDLLENSFGEKKMPRIKSALTELIKADLLEEMDDEVYKSTPYTDTYSVPNKELNKKMSKAPPRIHGDYDYVSKDLIDKFSNRNDGFNYSKLLKLFGEINNNFSNNNAYSTAALLRAVIDHIPPLLAKNNFNQVVSNHNWEKTDKSFMNQLLRFRDIADDSLHRPIGKKNLSDINMHDIPPKRALEVLLSECIEFDVNSVTPEVSEAKSSKKTIPENQPPLVSSISNMRWASNFFGFGAGFQIENLEINNYRGEDDYVKEVNIEGKKGNGDQWLASTFQFNGLKRNEKMHIPKDKVINISLFIGDNPEEHIVFNHLDLDRDKIELKITFLSGKERTHLFKPSDIQTS